MNENIAVNITIPKEAVDYLDAEARRTYLSRATVAKQLLLKHIDELRVISARKAGCSIRKIVETYNVDYQKVLEILHMTKVDADDRDADQYVEETMRELTKNNAPR
jgi:hypothetical protein